LGVGSWEYMVKPINNNFINLVYFDFIECLGITPNYFDCDFEISDLIEVNEFFKLLNESFLDASIFVVNNIKQQLEFIKFFNKRFINKHGHIKTGEISKLINSSSHSLKYRLEISSLNIETKIKTFKELVNNLWIKPKNGNNIKHSFHKKIKDEFTV
jgi:hypothetical protein